MDPFTIMAAASAIGGIGNFLANQSANDRANMLQNQALQQWIATQIPDPQEQKLALQKFVQQGQLDPKLENAIKADPSAFAKIGANSVDKTAQNRALSELENIGYEGGLRLQDKAALQDAQQKGIVQDRANRQAISADMARKGLAGSGYDVAAQLEGQQGGADRDARNSLSIAAQAQDRALKAIMGAGDLATQYQAQDYGQQNAAASAADKINMFNTQNLQGVQERNVAAQNATNAANLAQKQKTADQNTNNANYQQEFNSKLLQQQYDNQVKKAQGMSGQYQNLANTAEQAGKNAGNFASNLGGAVSGAATNQANSNWWDEFFKKKDKKFDYSGADGIGGGIKEY
jgi:hypothetical protein